MPARLRTMMALVAVAAAGSILLPIRPISNARATSPDTLIGLWKAKRWFGPHDRGKLVIQRAGASYTADFMGRTFLVREHQGALSCELPDGRAAFRGKLQPGSRLLGHWYSPSSALMAGFKYATPVQLRLDGQNRWTGQVLPPWTRRALPRSTAF
jgi:hypothetical protein